MGKGKRALRIVGLSLLFITVVVGLLSATVFVYAHVESQNYKRGITEQVKELNDKGEAGDVVRLKTVPFGGLLNSEYRQLQGLEDDYQKLYADFARYYADKSDYENKTKAYNEARQKGEDPDGGDELARQHDELQKTTEKLNKKIEDLRERFDNT